MAEMSIGSVLAGFRIEGLAGVGGMGRVYRATQMALNRRVALKVIAPELADEPDFRARFERESHLSASIDHPNVIPVYEAGEAEGRLFIAMRWVEGTDLRSVIVAEGRLDPERAVAIVEQVAAALDAAHRSGLVHRDVKPANVMLTTTHGEEHVYLTDFGLTKKASSTTALTRTGFFVGTPDYMPPEQIMGERADARSDVYALGCLLFHALTGHPPYDRGHEVAKMYAQVHDPPPSVVEAVPGTPAALDGVIARALAKNPDERYPSAGDLGRAARAALTGAVPSQPERNLATGLAAPQPAEPGATAPGAAGLAPELAPTAPPAAPPTPPPATPAPAAEPDPAPTAPPDPGPTAPPDPAPTAGPDPGPTAAPGGAPATPAPSPAEAPPPAAPAPPSPAPPGEPPRRRAWPIALAAAVVVGAVAAILVATGVFSGDEENGSPSAGGAGPASEDTPAPPRVVATIRAGDGPDGIAVDGNTVWVSNSRGDALTRLDANLNGPVGEPVPVGQNPDEVEAEDGVVWVSNTDDGTVMRLETDPEPVVTATAPVGAGPEGLSLGPQLVWVASGDSDSVTRLDRANGNLLPPAIAVENKPIGIFVGEDTVWVTNSFSGSVTRLDPSDSTLQGVTRNVGRNIRNVIEGFGYAWVASAVNNGTITRLDRETGKIVGDPIRVGDFPKEMAFAGGDLWVVNERSNNVMRIDPKTAKVVGKPIEVGRFPVGIAAGAGSLWVANNRSDTVTRIDPGG